MVVKIIQQIFLSHNKEDDDAGKKIGENSSVSGKQNQTDFFIHNKDDDAEKKIGGSTNKNTHNKDDDAGKMIGGVYK